MTTNNSVNSSTIPQLTSVEMGSTQRIFKSSVNGANVNIRPVSGTAYFVYCGYTSTSITPKYVEMLAYGGAGTQAAQVGIFSTPLPPNRANQTLTKIVATATVDSLTSGTTSTVVRNTSAFATSINAGKHIWAGIRFLMGTTQPYVYCTGFDNSNGEGLSTVGAASFTISSTWTGSIMLATSSNPNIFDLRLTLD